jgi:Na+/H+-dicarboxylate symporter
VSNKLLLATAIGAILGLALGALLGQANLSPTAIKLIKLPGTLFLRALKAIVMPLVVTSVIGGVAALRRAGGGSGLAGRTLMYYSATTIVAVGIGLVLVFAIHPGDPSRLGNTGADLTAARNATTYDAADTLLSVLYAMVPENIAAAAVQMDVLGLIVVAVCFALLASGAGRRGRMLLRFSSSVNHVVMLGVHYLVLATPVGVWPGFHRHIW